MDEIERIAEERFVEALICLWIQPDAPEWIIDYVRQELRKQRGLLKEQESKTGHWTVLEDCANSGIYCSECQCKIFDYTTKPKKKFSMYCPHCGSRNEQFFRDGEVVFR